MKVTSIRCLCFVVVVIAILAVSPVVNGQRNFDDVEIVTTQLDDNLYYLQGAGGQIGVLACSALGFLDSGLTVFASTLPRPARRGHVAPGRDFDSGTSPASTARCTFA